MLVSSFFPWSCNNLLSSGWCCCSCSACRELVLLSAALPLETDLLQAPPATQPAPEPDAGSPGKLLQQALAPLLHRLLTKTSPAKEANIQYLTKGEVAVPAAPQAPHAPLPPAPLPALEDATVAEAAEGAKAAADIASPTPPAKRLQDFEADAYEKITAKRARGASGMKRPAASREVTQPVPAEGPARPAGGKLKLGCKKCRGAVNGCDQCRNPAYTGLRLTREEWKRHAAEKGLK